MRTYVQPSHDSILASLNHPAITLGTI